MTRLDEVSPGTRGSPPHAPRRPRRKLWATSSPRARELGGSGPPVPAPSTGHASGPQAQNAAPPRTAADPCPSDRRHVPFSLLLPPGALPRRPAVPPCPGGTEPLLPPPAADAGPATARQWVWCTVAGMASPPEAPWVHCLCRCQESPPSVTPPGNLETPTPPRPRPGTTRRAARRSRPHRVPHGPPSSLCPSAGRVLTPGVSVPPGNHSGVVLSVNSREMHSYLVG